MPAQGPSNPGQPSAVASSLSDSAARAAITTIPASVAGHLEGSCSLPQQPQSRLAKMATQPALSAGPIAEGTLSCSEFDLTIQPGDRTTQPARLYERNPQAESSAHAAAYIDRPVSGLAASPATAAGSIHHLLLPRSCLPVAGTAGITAYKATVLDPSQPRNLQQSPVMTSHLLSELHTQAGCYKKKCASAPCSPRAGKAGSAWSVASGIYEHGRSSLSPRSIMHEVPKCSRVPGLFQWMTPSGTPNALTQSPDAAGAFLGATLPDTDGGQQKACTSSLLDSISSGPSLSGSPSQIGSDVAASSPRGMAALLIAGGSSEASTHAAPESPANTSTMLDNS